MEPSDLSPAASRTIQRLLAEADVDDSYLAFVARHLTADDGTWRWCCGSNCDPCVQRLGRIVDQARQALGLAAPPAAGEGRPS
jgi:hypothetical protein